MKAIDASERSPGVFIIGSPRSGTSVLSWALASHPSFWTSAESDYLLDLFGAARLHNAYKTAFERPDGGWLFKNNVGFAEFSAAVGLGIEALYESRSKGRRWVDATPGYTLMAEQLALMFPASKFVHILRDGRSVVSSMIRSGFEASWASDFNRACQTWSHFASRARRFLLAKPARAIEVRYETLTANPDQELQRIFEFLGEKPCASSVELIETRRINSSYGNVEAEDIRKVKDPRTAPKRPWTEWTRSQTSTFRRLAGDTMNATGYPPD